MSCKNVRIMVCHDEAIGYAAESKIHSAHAFIKYPPAWSGSYTPTRRKMAKRHGFLRSDRH